MKKFTVDWTGLRKNSATIPDFVGQLLSAIKRYPVGDRQRILFTTLNEISPEIVSKVKRETEFLVKRGYAPEKALNLAIVVTLRSRRRRIFHWLFFTYYPKLINDFLANLKKLPNDAERAKALAKFVNGFSTMKLADYDQKQAFIRLKETNFPPEVIKQALSMKRRSPDEVLAEIRNRIKGDEDEDLVMRDELHKLMFEHGLFFMMAQGVAKGPDFCIFAAVLAAAAAAVTIATTIATNVTSSKAQAAAERKLNHAARVAELTTQGAAVVTGLQVDAQPLSEEEIRQAAAASAALPWAEARQTLLDVLRNARNRETPQALEESRFRALWGRYKQESSSAGEIERIVGELGAQYQEQVASVELKKKINLAVVGVSAISVIGGLGYLATRK
jgi:hypothetical protein